MIYLSNQNKNRRLKLSTVTELLLTSANTEAILEVQREVEKKSCNKVQKIRAIYSSVSGYD